MVLIHATARATAPSGAVCLSGDGSPPCITSGVFCPSVKPVAPDMPLGAVRSETFTQAEFVGRFHLVRLVVSERHDRTARQSGSPLIVLREARSLSQFARLEKQICASGVKSIGLSSAPAGTTSMPTSA